jgi:O-antigen/teichoic acid export membrane protein
LLVWSPSVVDSRNREAAREGDELTPQAADALAADAWEVGWDPVPADSVAARATRGVMTAMVRLVFLQGGAYIALLLIGRQVSPAVFGVYGITYGAVMLAMRVALGGFQPLLAREPGRLQPAVLANATRVVLAGGGLVAAITVLAAVVFPAHALLLVACAVFIVSIGFRMPALILLSRGVQIGRIAWIQAIDTLGFQLIVLGLIVSGAEMEMALAVALLVIAVASPVACRILAPWPPLFSAPLAMRDVTRASLPYYGYATLFNIRELGLLPLVGLLAGTVVAGEFTWAFSLALIPQVVTLAVVEILYSPLAFLASSRKRFDDAALLIIRMAFALSCAVAAVIGACLTTFLTTLAGGQWIETQTLTWVLLAATVVSAMEFVLGTISMAEGHVKAVTKARTFEVVATILVAITTLTGASSATGFAVGLLVVRLIASVWLWHQASNGWFRKLARVVVAVVLGGVLGGLVGSFAGLAISGIGVGALVVIAVVTTVLSAAIVHVVDGGRVRGDVITLLHLARSQG